MKKTMFITSVIMVVVMAIALTTSSLAWFTAGGADHVTTDTLKVTAQGTTSTGIAISHDKEQWANSIVLTSTGTTGLNALVPYTTLSTAEMTDATNSEKYDALLAALVGGKENAYDADTNADAYGTTSNDTPYAAKMIGAKIDSNRKFTDDVMRTGFYTDTLYLKNLAGGAAAADIKFDVAISFGFHKIVGTGEDAVNTFFDYTQANRTAALYQEDAVLCVAVLARTDEFDTDANIDAGLTYNDLGGWEIIGYADSKGRTTISLGKSSAEFLAGQACDSSFADASISNLGLNKTNSEALRPERTGPSGATLPATIKTVKVVAWYDGPTLTNNNSTKMDLEFALDFTKQAAN